MHPETLALWLVAGVCCLLCLWIVHLIKANGKLLNRLQNLAARNYEKHATIRELQDENKELKKMVGV